MFIHECTKSLEDESPTARRSYVRFLQLSAFLVQDYHIPGHASAGHASAVGHEAVTSYASGGVSWDTNILKPFRIAAGIFTLEFYFPYMNPTTYLAIFFISFAWVAIFLGVSLF